MQRNLSNQPVLLSEPLDGVLLDWQKLVELVLVEEVDDGPLFSDSGSSCMEKVKRDNQYHQTLS